MKTFYFEFYSPKIGINFFVVRALYERLIPELLWYHSRIIWVEENKKVRYMKYYLGCHSDPVNLEEFFLVKLAATPIPIE